MLAVVRELTIEWGDCDPAGIVFFPRYFEMFDVSTNSLLEAAAGMNKAAILRHYGILSIPLVETRAKFHASSSYGDRVRIESAFGEVRRSSFDITHKLMREDLLAVESVETRVWVGRHPEDPERRKAQPIPAELIDRFTATDR